MTAELDGARLRRIRRDLPSLAQPPPGGVRGASRRGEPARRPLRRRLHARPPGARSSGPRATVGCGERFGLDARPVALRRGARAARSSDLQPPSRSSTTTRRSGSRSPSAIVRGMGGDSATAARDVRRRDDARAGSTRTTSSSTTTCCRCSTSCAGTGLKLGLVSNTGARPRRVRRAPRGSTSTRASAPAHHGKTKPHPSIFRAVLERLDVEPDEAAMVGDSHRRRHRGRAGARHAGGPARPARAATRTSSRGSTTCCALPAALGLEP